jgi:hypothetical protein
MVKFTDNRLRAALRTEQMRQINSSGSQSGAMPDRFHQISRIGLPKS